MWPAAVAGVLCVCSNANEACFPEIVEHSGSQRTDLLLLLLLLHCGVLHRQPRVQAAYCCGDGTAGVLQAADHTGV
jgi:hypothetical protein